ncbi:28057_t:CDS:2 [Gigaspora margarita]|uniref:28057_t:CDS:1 n=1 Tax=Gigaspora margarita TaxID=4874 RepID=A0ABN7UGD8_GIGMA|nr:28057_t:CDS:2 [Gigaspora margarita]
MNSYTSNSPRHPDSWSDEMKKMNLGSLADIKGAFDPWNAISNMERLWTNFDPKGLSNIVIQPSSNNQCRIHIFKELHAKLGRDYCFNTTNYWCHITDLYEVAAFLHDFTHINVKDSIFPPLETVDSELFRALGSLTPVQQNVLGKTILNMNTQDILKLPLTPLNDANSFNPYLGIIEPSRQGICYKELEDIQDDNLETPEVIDYLTTRKTQGISTDIRYLEMDWHTAKKSILVCYQCNTGK